MTRAPATGFLAAVAMAFAVAAVVVDRCDNVPSMSMDDACLKASTLCHGELLTAPESGEVTVYAVISARWAQRAYEATSRAYEATSRAAAGLLGNNNASLAAGERAAYEACVARYASARARVMAAQSQLLGCSYASPKQELIDARVDVEACDGELSGFAASPLHAMNADDQLKATLAYELTGLIIGK
uniref:Pectinesterase inhibitor domain-containing protein n=1 Tax=Oryza glumipatula TaxID=40148 RepID=A0A0E0AQP7_9ORYZ